jgi:hypothetical protein
MIRVQGQLREKVTETPILTNKLGMMVHAYNLSCLGSSGSRIMTQSWLGKKQETLSEK